MGISTTKHSTSMHSVTRVEGSPLHGRLSAPVGSVSNSPLAACAKHVGYLALLGILLLPQASLASNSPVPLSPEITSVTGSYVTGSTATVAQGDTVSFNQLHIVNSWTSSNHENSSVSKKSWQLYCREGSTISFDYSVSSESNCDWLTISLNDNCVIKGSNRGLGIQNRDEGTVTDVVFSNIILDCHLWSDVWWGKAEPIYVTSYPRANGNHKDANWRFPKGQTVGKCGEVSRIYFNNIYATSENGCFIGGDTKDKVRDIYLNNVHLNLKKVTSYDGGVYDKRPCRGEGFIYNKVYGVYVEQATNVEVDDLKVIADPKINYGGKTFGIDD